MPKETTKMQSWQIFHFARKHLLRSTLYAIFGKWHARTIDRWCEDPRYTDKPEKAYDPIQGVKDLLETLDDQGHCDVVRATLAFLSSGTSLGCGVIPAITDIKPTISEEIIADYRAVATMQAAIEDGAPIEKVAVFKHAALEEIERTYAKYLDGFLQ